MDSADFLTVASKLCPSTSEAERRTAVGRSYYALYILLHDELRKLGVPLRNGPEDHGEVVYYLTRCPPLGVAATVGQALNDLRRDRNTADYEMSAVISKSKSEFVYKKALECFRNFKSLDGKELARLRSCFQFLPARPRK